MSDERLLHTQEVSGSTPFAPTTNPRSFNGGFPAEDHDSSPDPLRPPENGDCFGSSMAAKPEAATPERSAASWQLTSDRLIFGSDIRLPLGVPYTAKWMTDRDRSIIDVQPVVPIREATELEYRLSNHNYNGPLMGAEYFYEVTTD